MKKILITILVISLVLTSLIPLSSVFAADPGPDPKAGYIQLLSFNSDISPITKTLTPNFKLVNTGIQPIKYSDIKIRYNFTNEGTSPNTFKCISSTVGASNVTGKFADITPPLQGADRYCEIGFNSAAGILKPGESVEVKLAISKEDMSSFDQKNDISFNGEATDYTPPTQGINVTIDYDITTGVVTITTSVTLWGFVILEFSVSFQL